MIGTVITLIAVALLAGDWYRLRGKLHATEASLKHKFENVESCLKEKLRQEIANLIVDAKVLSVGQLTGAPLAVVSHIEIQLKRIL